MQYQKFIFYSLLYCTYSCSNSSPIDLIDSQAANGTISYKNNIEQIITNNCTNCHGTIPTNGSPMSLNSVATVKEAIQNRGLIDRLNLDQNNILAMPLGGPKLLQTQIDAIVKWQNEGFAN